MTVVLGAGSNGTPLPNAAFDAAELFVAMEVDGVALGRQQVWAAAQAARAARASDLSVTGALTVSRTTTLGALSVESESIALTGTNWTTLSIGHTRGAGLVFVTGSNDMPSAVFSYADDSGRQRGVVNDREGAGSWWEATQRDARSRDRVRPRPLPTG